MQLADLFESRGASLYHGTSVYAAERILHEDRILPKTTQLIPWIDGPINGVSLTRNPRFARKFGNGIVFEIDERRLSHRHRIIPFDYWHRTATSDARRKSRWAESEEFVVGPIAPLSRYLVRIWVSRSIMSISPLVVDLARKISEHPLAVMGEPTSHEIRALGKDVA